MRILKLQRPRLTGRDVIQLRERLWVWKFGADVWSDVFDDAVYEAVRQFQSYYGIPSDGLVDDETWRALFSEPVQNQDNALIQSAKSLLGIPYIWGSSNIHLGLDGPGFVEVVLKKAGQPELIPDPSIDRLWWELEPAGQPVTGELVFYSTSANGKPSHLMMVLDSSRCIGPTGGNSKTTSVERAVQRDARVKVKSIWYRSYLIGYRALRKRI